MDDHRRVYNTLDALKGISQVIAKIRTGEELFGQVFDIPEDERRHLELAETIILRERLDLALKSGLLDRKILQVITPENERDN